ncbi:hypothetical protein AEGHOMDF_2494 [Methylobacterium soli]|nr:hypothetical protein AEGHOMDF_2494 [Methylobacterium soli]
MHDRAPAPRLVGLDQGEGRARHVEVGLAREGADQRAGQGGLAAAEPAREGDEIARQKEIGQEMAEILGGALLGQNDLPGGGSRRLRGRGGLLHVGLLRVGLLLVLRGDLRVVLAHRHDLRTGTSEPCAPGRAQGKRACDRS